MASSSNRNNSPDTPSSQAPPDCVEGERCTAARLRCEEMLAAMIKSTSICKTTTRRGTHRWSKADSNFRPSWIPKQSLLSRLWPGSVKELDPMEEFRTRFQQLIRDMWYVTELANNPIVGEQCGFKQDWELLGWTTWCEFRIEWLEDDGFFPQVEYIREREATGRYPYKLRWYKDWEALKIDLGKSFTRRERASKIIEDS